MRIKQGLEFRRLGDEGILLDPETAVFYRLSSGAAACWEQLQAAETRELDPALLAEFAQHGLLDGVAPGGLTSPGAITPRVVGESVFTAAKSPGGGGGGGCPPGYTKVKGKCVPI